jgi:class 3 adenylate cyclase
MGIKMRDRAKEILGHWQSMGLEVGLGIGIASGHVTVGAIGGTERLEYVAVGPAVNLAARLCSLAESGKVLVDQRTVGLVGENSSVFRFERRGSFELKGLARETTVFEVCTAPETGSGRAAAAGAQQESQS